MLSPPPPSIEKKASSATGLSVRELRITKIENRIHLFPGPVVKYRKYLIFCSSKEEGIIEEVRLNKVTHPDLISEDFVFLTFHIDKQTKIFVRKS